MVRVIGLGNPGAGDDGVGFAVIDALEALGRPGLELVRCADPSRLPELLEDGAPVVLVDAVLGAGPPGRALRLDPAALDRGPRPLTSHGLGVAGALALAAALGVRPGPLAVVGVAVPGGLRVGPGLSEEVGVGVQAAAIYVSNIANELIHK